MITNKFVPIWLIIVLSLMILISCKVDRNSTILKPNNHITQFSDTTYFSWFWNIHSSKKHFFFGDYENNRIIQLDKNLKKINQFGKRGKGPAEFNGAGSVFIDDDTLIAYDDAGSRFNYFDINSGKYIKSVTVNRMDMITRFVILNENIYYPENIQSFKINVVNEFGKIINEIGANANNILSIRPEIGLRAHLLKYKNDLLVAFKNVPYLLRYSHNGKNKMLINYEQTLSFPELEGLWEQINSNEKQNSLSRSSNIYFTDATVENSIVYILTSSWPNNGDAAYIIRYQITDNGFKPLPVFRIQGIEKRHNLFNAIAVSKNLLIGYEARSNALFTFDLTELKENESK